MDELIKKGVGPKSDQLRRQDDGCGVAGATGDCYGQKVLFLILIEKIIMHGVLEQNHFH